MIIKFYPKIILLLGFMLLVNCLLTDDNDSPKKTGKIIDTIYNYDTLYLIDSTTFDTLSITIDSIVINDSVIGYDTTYVIDTIEHGDYYIIDGIQLVTDTTDLNEKSEEFLFCAFYLDGYFLYRDSMPVNPMSFNTIEGMYYSVMEPYTRYYDPIISVEINKILTTTSGGTGIYVDSLSNGYLVFDVVPNSPGENAGILVKDTIVRVNDVSVIGLPYDDMLDYLSGQIGTTNKYSIKRGVTEIEISVTMQEFLDRSVFIDSISNEIALITLTTFTASSFMNGGSAAEFKAALNQTSWAEWTIFDLRQNGGGRLDQCISITSEFVDSGSQLMKVRERDFNFVDTLFETVETSWYAETGQTANNRKFYVLMDDGSASASEVVIVSLMEHRPDVITVGTRTYGKARGQVFIPTPQNGIARITSMVMEPYSGIPYDVVGLIPQIEIDEAKYALDTAIARISDGRSVMPLHVQKNRAIRRSIGDKFEKTGPLLYKKLNKISTLWYN